MPVLLVITRGDPAEAAALAVAVVLSAAVLVGIGLLFAGLLKTQQQVNTWSGVIAAASAGSRPSRSACRRRMPSTRRWRSSPRRRPSAWLANAFAGRTLYPHEWLSYAVLLAWGVGVYGLLWWRLSRQEEA